MNKKLYNKKFKSINLRRLTVIILILLIIGIVLVLVCKNYLIPKRAKEQKLKEIDNRIENIVNSTKTTSDTTSADYQLSLLKQGTERDRIEYYCGQFFKYIENKNYAKAYEILYPEFKQQYFPTIEEFTKYVQKIYPSVLVINYDDFDRQGDIYITTVIVDDAFATDKTKQFSQRIIVQESDYNKYVLSFQVI